MKILLFIILIANPFSSFADNNNGLNEYKLAKQLYLDDKVLESFQMFLNAAKKGNAQAQYQMGWMLSNKHKGITRDKSKAMYWYEKAALQGCAEAQVNLASHLINNIPIDYQEGIYWYEKAAAQGNSAAPFLLELIYKQGTGVIKDEDRAAIWHEIYLENEKKGINEHKRWPCLILNRGSDK